MQATVSHPIYGLIIYDENFWTGKRVILVGGVPLIKIKKTDYELPATAETPAVAVTVKGNYVSGVTMTIGDEVITLVEKPAASDYVLGCLPAILFFLFVMGGAIGGALAGLMGFGGILLMKSRPNMKQKLLISLGASAVIVAIGVGIILYAVYVASLMQNM
jgi:hypothetical protein